MSAVMNATSPRAFMLSASLHGAVIAVLVAYAVWNNRDRSDPMVTITLVAGEGDNYAAKEAPALGSEGGVKLTVPEVAVPAAPPTPTPAVTMTVPPPEVAPPVAQPKPQPLPEPPKPIPVPAPAPKAPAEKAAPTKAAKNPDVPDFKKKIQWEIVKADANAKAKARREREAEAKRLAEEKKRMTLEEFNRTQKTRQVASAKNAAGKVEHIDGEGIAKGVVGGSTANKVGGAGGKALKNDNPDVIGAYLTLFRQELRRLFEPPPGLSDSLKVRIEVLNKADGSLSGAKVVQTSGSREFDQAVLDALKRIRLPQRPDRKSEELTFTFSMKELE